MATLKEMVQRTSSTPEYDRMIRSVQPMCNYFGINQFYFTRIQSKGDLGYVSSIGKNLSLQEFFFENTHLMQQWPILRHPNTLESACINLKYSEDSSLNTVLETAWDKFKTNLVIHIQRKTRDAIEQFGVGLNSKHPKAEQHLLNELPLLSKFINFFYEENQKLIHHAFDHQVEISKLLGPCFFETSNPESISEEKNLLLKQFGLKAALSLTMREREVLRFLAHGYPASYIAEQLHLSTRTVEHHIETIKEKLHCDSRVALIKTAHEISSIFSCLSEKYKKM